MTYDITHGVGGLFEVHRWTSAGGLVFDLNVDAEDADDRVALDEIPGLHALPPSEDPRAKRSGRHGDVSRDRTFGGKPVVYKGELTCSTLPGLYVARSAALAAFADRRPGVMQIIRHEDFSGPTAQFTARVLECDIPDVIASYQPRRAFTLGLFLDDPRIYFPTLAVDETGVDAATVENVGTAPADPIVTVDFDYDDQVTIDDGISQVLRTKALVAADVDGQVVFDFARRTVSDANGNPLPLDMTFSRWWDPFVDGIAPGAEITVTSASATGIRVQFVPSVWG